MKILDRGRELYSRFRVDVMGRRRGENQTGSHEFPGSRRGSRNGRIEGGGGLPPSGSVLDQSGGELLINVVHSWAGGVRTGWDCRFFGVRPAELNHKREGRGIAVAESFPWR